MSGRNGRLRIDRLADRDDCVRTVARWQTEAWGWLRPEETLPRRAAALRRQKRGDALPLTLVACDGREPVGSASLEPHVMENHPELTPWLSRLYVDPRHRRQGIGTMLCEEIASIATRRGKDCLYLMTVDDEPFFARRGFTPRFRETYLDQRVTVMARQLTPDTTC